MSIDLGQTIAELRSLSVADRLRVVQAVWDSLPDDAPAVLSPEQRTEVNRRLDAYEAAPDDLLTWDQVTGVIGSRAKT